MARIIHIEQTSSTNEYLQQLLKTEKEEGLIVWADFQTAGKGQTGNSWEAEVGKNLTFSIVFYPDFVDATEQFILSQFVSLAITDVLAEYIPEGLSIKWPNDIYVHNKKIAGILIENAISGRQIDRCIAGIGLNINQEAFLSNAPNPISLFQIKNKKEDIKEILSKLQDRLLARYMQIFDSEEEQIKEDYKQILYRRDGFHKYQAEDKIFMAKIKNILQTGQLVLENTNGEKMEFAFKEVRFLM